MIKIDNIESIVENFVPLCGDDRDAVVIGTYETVVDAFNYLMKNTDSQFVCGELELPEMDGYDDGWYVIFDKNEIWTGKIKTSDHYDCVAFDCDYAYVEYGFEEAYLSNNTDDGMVVFTYSTNTNGNVNDHPCVIYMNDDNTGFTFCFKNDLVDKKFQYVGNIPLEFRDIVNIVEQYMMKDSNFVLAYDVFKC